MPKLDFKKFVVLLLLLFSFLIAYFENLNDHNQNT